VVVGKGGERPSHPEKLLHGKIRGKKGEACPTQRPKRIYLRKGGKDAGRRQRSLISSPRGEQKNQGCGGEFVLKKKGEDYVGGGQKDERGPEVTNSTAGGSLIETLT